ncbi:hypothetical protein CEXT_228951 [Caerostris extrusa]|uniref:Uncharacterized protein n=1 Tax=Caerostris extrusa TaxID=172846 RepID=A0AAV4NSZ9_CAEEX|nr:hypothetical protein CEXT_228951 [Caerostris extrusa]
MRASSRFYTYCKNRLKWIWNPMIVSGCIGSRMLMPLRTASTTFYKRISFFYPSLPQSVLRGRVRVGVCFNCVLRLWSETIMLPGCQFSLALNTPQIHLLISWLDPPLFGFDSARSTYGRLLARLALIMWGSIP